MKRDAVVSECGQYRYSLTRRWDEGSGRCVFIMLNPSTADAMMDDPTIRRCIGFAQEWGFAMLEVVNLYAFRATDPKDLFRAADSVGPENWEYIWTAVRSADLVVCAWGKPGHGRGRWMKDELIRKAAIRLHVLKLNRDGSPAHPLYLSKNLQPMEWQ